MLQINDCFYSFKKQGLFLVTGFAGKSIIIRTLYKVIPDSDNYYAQMQLGYYSKGNMVCPPKYLTGERSVSSEVFFRIEKLLEMNRLVCKTLCANAEKLTTGDIKVADSGYWLITNNKCKDINISTHALFISESSSFYAFYYINEETYQKIKTNCDKTIKLIDDIWPKKSS